MKEKFLNYSINEILKKKELSEEEIEEYRYNLEGFYLTISKLLIMIPLSIIFNVFFEMILFIIIFNFIREPAHGLHASKSYICLITSSITFIGIPYISKIIELNLYTRIIISVIGFILIIVFAPADTEKAPIIRKEKRLKLKIKSTIIALIMITLSFIINNNMIINLLLFSIVLESILINPLTYKIFHLKYNNYIDYLKNMN